MPNVNLITGNDSSNTLTGGSGPDLIYGFNPDGPQGTVTSIGATRVATGFSQPLFAGAPPDDTGRLFIVEKTGLIKIIDLGTGQILPTPFLDLMSQISTAGEGGLIGLAFDPNFATNGYFYVDLINTNGDTEVRRYQVSANPNVADPASVMPVVSIDQPAGLSNHKAGWLGFGPDGNLYVATGDGGGGGDPLGSGQDINSLLGKMLRLDVHADAFPTDPTRNYAIPAGNMFVGTAGADEIFALGLRNPFRNSFDRATGDFYIADVGQNAWEEIDIGQSGANYGWNVYEGPATFAGGTPSAGTLTFPIYSYDHSVGAAVIGGYAYRGQSEGLQGQYFFADEVSNKVFTLHFNGSAWVATERTSQITTDAGAINNPSSFGEDGLGNLYLVDLDGDVFRLTPNVTSADQGDSLDGRDGNDMIYGGSGDDTISGGTGNDKLFAGIGNDMLSGGPENDQLVGGPGNDAIDGELGFDEVVFTGARSAYSITYDPGTKVFTVVDQRAGSPDGTDTVHDVEQFQFGGGVSDANALTAQTVTHGDGSTTVTIFDAVSAFNWILYDNDYDPSSRLTKQTVYESNGNRWINEFDPANSFSWSQRTTGVDADSNLITQRTTNDDGSHVLIANDIAGLFGWSQFTVNFDANWTITSRNGLRDDSSAMTAGEIYAALDVVVWYPQGFDTSHDLIPHI